MWYSPCDSSAKEHRLVIFKQTYVSIVRALVEPEPGEDPLSEGEELPFSPEPGEDPPCEGEEPPFSPEPL